MASPTTAGNPIGHIEIPAPDLKRAMEFYSRVFGWQVKQVPGMDRYGFWSTEGNSGGFDPDARPSADGTILVLEVADIPAKLAEIEAAGGKKIKEKTALPANMGFYAYFSDPNGVRLGLWSKT